VCSVGDLLSRVVVPGKMSKFNIIIGDGGFTQDINTVDVGALQADPENRGATFQVASNLNCLEFINQDDTASKGISKYIYDHTQGPAASISAAPGTVYRNYFVPHVVEGVQYTGQLKEQINLINSFPYITVRNGYVTFTDSEIEFFKSIGMDFNDLKDIKVGIQTNVQVTSGLKKGGKITLCKSPEQVINQVFTCGVNLGGKNAVYAHIPEVKELAKYMLKGAYRATILSAIENSQTQPAHYKGKDKLYLTLIGGGVFGNDHDWITEAIYSCADLIKKAGLQIYLIIYSKFTVSEDALQILQFLVQETAGILKTVK